VLTREGAEAVLPPESLDPGPQDKPIYLFGNALDLCLEKLESLQMPDLVMRDSHPYLAHAMAEEAISRLEKGGGVPPEKLRMNYIRLSDAEEAARSTET